MFYSSRKKKSRCPWMTPELLHLIHKRKSLHRKVVLSCHQNREALLQHRKLRNIVNNLYRQLKNAYFQDCLNQYRKLPRKLWSAINHVLGRQRQSLPVSDNIIPDITDHFRLLYVDSVNSCELPFGPAAQSSFTEFKPVHKSEVKRLLKDLIPNKAPGPDDISPLELKLASGKIAATVAALFNESLSSGTLPEQFKMAKLHPLLKPGKTDTSLPANYRGISLTCIISKLLEKIVCNQVSAFMTENGVFSEYQYSFRKVRSCSDLLVATIDDWRLAQDANKYTAIDLIRNYCLGS